jgi:hypothetical protein
VVIALASRSRVQVKRLDGRQVSQWAFGLAGVRIPSPAFFNHLGLIPRLFWMKNLDLYAREDIAVSLIAPDGSKLS